MSLRTLAADIASRVLAMAEDCAVNNERLILGLLENEMKDQTMITTTDAQAGQEPCSESTYWRRGEPPLGKIVLLWNGAMMTGQYSFKDNDERTKCMEAMKEQHGSYPTHYLVVPKCNA